MKFLQKTTIPGPIKYMSGSLLPDNVLSPKKDQQPRSRVDRSYSGPLQHLQKNKFTKSLSVEDVLEGPVVQQKGRFKVTEADVSPKPPVINPSSNGIVSPPTPSIRAASLLPSLQSILQHNTVQREEILRLIKFAEQTPGSSSGNPVECLDIGNNDFSQIPPTQKERELHARVIQLQQSVGSLNEQLMKQKIEIHS